MLIAPPGGAARKRYLVETSLMFVFVGNAVDAISTRSLVVLPEATLEGVAVKLTPAGWEVFCAVARAQTNDASKQTVMDRFIENPS
jgi:hypothetical protein